MKVLVTCGAGYIGSVTTTGLVQAGHIRVTLDWLISGPEAFVGNIADRALLGRPTGPMLRATHIGESGFWGGPARPALTCPSQVSSTMSSTGPVGWAGRPETR